MRILVLSDSHGRVENMVQAVEAVRPRMILHLGDVMRDAEKLARLFPGLPMEQVPGNCDLRPDEPAERLLFIEDKRVLMCHGHTYGVKSSLSLAGRAAQEKQIDLFLFGHTHKPLWDFRGRTVFVNPGSIGEGARPTYAVVEIENGTINGRIYELGEPYPQT